MYNLLVSHDSDSWDGTPFILDTTRFLEYTDTEVRNKFLSLSDSQKHEIMRLPCIFAYEGFCKKDPYFGLIQEIVVRQQALRIQYEIIPLPKFLTADLMNEFQFELDIHGWELSRTHWAIKDIDLSRELYRKDIILPDWINRERRSVDITKHHFQVALSFPGEIRDYILPIVQELERTVGPDSYFYDNNYKAQLARPSLDTLLQSIYERSKLIVVFLCGEYQEKKWCGIEFRVVRDILFSKNHDKIMYVRMDDGEVEGVLNTDGYIDGRTHSAREIAHYIRERIDLLESPK